MKKSHYSLIDPSFGSTRELARLARMAEKAGTDAIVVGGSDSLYSESISKTVSSLKKSVGIPVVQILRDSSEISESAAAAIVPLVLNSSDVNYAIGIALNSLHILKKLGIPAIPIGYVLIGGGSTASFVSKALPLSLTRPKIIRHLAIASECLGLRAIYLEAGSGSRKPVPPEFIKSAKEGAGICVIVGGGIRSKADAIAAYAAGADVVITGSIIEDGKGIEGIIDARNRFRSQL